MGKYRIHILIGIAFIAVLLLIQFFNQNSERKRYQNAQALMDDWEGNPLALQQAEDLLIKMLKANRKSALVHAGLGRLAYKTGYINRDNYEPAALESARDQLNEAIRLDSTLFDAYYYSTYLEMFSKDLDAAKKMAAKAESIEPGSPKVHLLYCDLAL